MAKTLNNPICIGCEAMTFNNSHTICHFCNKNFCIECTETGMFCTIDETIDDMHVEHEAFCCDKCATSSTYKINTDKKNKNKNKKNFNNVGNNY
jgi:hypothetical protein